MPQFRSALSLTAHVDHSISHPAITCSFLSLADRCLAFEIRVSIVMPLPRCVENIISCFLKNALQFYIPCTNFLSIWNLFLCLP